MSAEFDRYAEKYAELLRDPIRDRFAATPNFFYRRKIDLIARYLQRHQFPSATASWLDIGCGRGELLALAGHLFGRAVGCELSQGMHTGATCDIRHQQSPAVLPFPDESHDFVTAVCVYHHIEDRDRLPLTREIFRVLRPGGVLCIVEHNPLNPVTRLIAQRCPVDRNARLLTAACMKRYLRLSGLRPAGCEYFLYLPEQWYGAIGWVENWLALVPLGGQYAVFGEKRGQDVRTRLA